MEMSKGNRLGFLFVFVFFRELVDKYVREFIVYYKYKVFFKRYIRSW